MSSRDQRPLTVDDGRMDGNDAFVLAGLVVGGLWTPPMRLRGSVLPAAVVTVSECLTDAVGPVQGGYGVPWFGDRRTASAAAARASVGVDDLRLLAVHALVADLDAVVALVDGWSSDVSDPVRGNLAAKAEPVGEPRGFEVVGFEATRVHSWLCYGLHERAIAVGHDLRLTRLGLLTSRERAQAVAAMANADRNTSQGTPLDVMWYPVLVTECQT